MKFKLDENIPVRSVQRLRDLGHDVDTVLDEGRGGHSDGSVWEAAQMEGRFLITQDLDFSEMRRFAPGTHFGILLVRLEDREQPKLPEYLEAWLAGASVEKWPGALVVASPRKIRVMLPGA